MFLKKHLFSSPEKKQIVEAISKAEKLTSGEIRVHVEAQCKGNALDRAAEVFYKLEMNKTVLRNGVLIYVAYEDKKLAIIGDRGINEVVPDDFWDSTLEVMTSHFKQGNFVSGVIYGIEESGKHLVKFFPYYAGDKNELKNDISEG
ncbi:MAG: hypothetical protein JWO03_3195 [Bacteroidetes bacterium]|nr:hypothetical protein [Bacteroidota bacterium]